MSNMMVDLAKSGEDHVNRSDLNATELSDESLWHLVLEDDTSAFEIVVDRYKGAVSGVAYCVVGDMSRCQDISQETFWNAWKQRSQLRDASKLASWLCGIARNLAKRSLIQDYRKFRMEDIESWDVASTELDPALASVTREQNEQIWNSLEKLPESYREAIAIFYRQGESIAYVASSLDISVDAAKQRLSRGREMLRQQFSNVIEEVLSRSTPSRVFTSRVMVGVAAWSIAMKASSAVASGVATTGAVAGGISKGLSTLGASKTLAAVSATGATVGVIGGVAGGVGGLGGAWLGTWLPTQLASTTQERDLLRLYGGRMFRDSVLFTLGLLAATGLFWLPMGVYLYFIAWAGLMIWFLTMVTIRCIQANRQLAAIRMRDPSELTPVETPLRKHLARYRWEGLRYTSKLSLLGTPLIDIQFSDVRFGMPNPKPSRAKGWIAVGDVATGYLFAFGGRATGLIAFGGVAIGGVAFGGVSVGGFCLGGLAVGILAIGGGSIGYDSAGGASCGWHSASGGLAIAKHAAAGGLACATDYAMGGSAFARIANSPEAKDYINHNTMFWLLEWQNRNTTLATCILVLPAVLMSAFLKLFYRKVKIASKEESLQNTGE